MSNDWFVGFRPNLTNPKNFRKFQHRVQVDIAAPLSQVFSALISEEVISRVLDDTVRFDARPGGKLRFLSSGDAGYGGTYSLIKVPTRVIIVTERHGELDFRLSDKGPHTPADIRATRMSNPEAKEQWIALIEQIAQRLSHHVTEG